MAEPHHHHDEPRGTDREIIITDRGPGGGPGALIAVIVAVLLIVLIAWLFLGGLFTGDGGDINVDVPEEIEVEQQDGGGGDTGGTDTGGTDTGGDTGGGTTTG